MTKKLISWSGGKDSTCSIILAKIHGIHIDGICIAEVMFDRRRNISGENPIMMEFIYHAEEVFKSWGFPVYHLRSETTDYLDIFHHRIQNARKHPENNGLRHGFPCAKYCSVRRDCKLRTIEAFLKREFPDHHMYVGIAADEPRRLARLKNNPNRSSLLEEYGYTEDMARALCEEYGLLSPAYNRLSTSRGGCWMCEFSKLEESRLIKETMPEIWAEFCSLEEFPDLAMPLWASTTKETLKERDRRLLKGVNDEDE